MSRRKKHPSGNPAREVLPKPIEGVVVHGAVVTYLLASSVEGDRPVQLGTRPHVAYAPAMGLPQCEADLTITDGDGTTVERCTREEGHRSALHVKHHRMGLPAVAWYVTESRGGVDLPTALEAEGAIEGEQQ